MQATPSTWRLLLESGWSGDGRLKMLCGGEALPRELAERMLDACGILYNLYGPTETTVWSTLQLLAPEEESILIGRPIDNTQCYILDSRLRAGADWSARRHIHRRRWFGARLSRTSRSNRRAIHSKSIQPESGPEAVPDWRCGPASGRWKTGVSRSCGCADQDSRLSDRVGGDRGDAFRA